MALAPKEELLLYSSGQPLLSHTIGEESCIGPGILTLQASYSYVMSIARRPLSKQIIYSRPTPIDIYA